MDAVSAIEGLFKPSISLGVFNNKTICGAVRDDRGFDVI